MEAMTPELQAYVAEVKTRYPAIRPAREDDYEWRDEGMEFMDKCDFAKAEAKFQQLLLSQPEHSDGYEGLALLYEKMGRKKEALMLIDQAIFHAERFVKEGEMDKSFLEDMKRDRERIRAMKEP